MLRGAILGAGNVAVHGHLPGWLARGDVAIVAAADPRPEAWSAFRERVPGARWYSSAQELLSREALDFADVCAPPAMHAGLIAASLGRDLHVLCEKPLVFSPGELVPLAELARDRGLALSTVHNWRFSPNLAAAEGLVRSGAIGPVRSCRWETLRERPAGTAAAGEANWRVDPRIAGGGVLLDHGWHALYVVCGWLPEPPCRVAARLRTRVHHEWPVEDTAEVAIETPGGASAEIFLTWAANERRNRIRIEGNRGEIRLDGRVLEAAGESREFAQSLSDGSHHPDWFGGVAEAFVADIGDPSRRGASLSEAALCLDVIAAARESSLRGGESVAIGDAARASVRPARRSMAT